jgi:cell division protein FtsB
MSSTAASQLTVGSFPQHSRTVERALANTVTLLPSWIYLAMIIIAAAAICLTVNFRGHTQLNSAEWQFRQMEKEIATLRRANASLQTEVIRITTEPATIESAARARLGMVRPTDVVVPLQSRSATNLASISFVR